MSTASRIASGRRTGGRHSPGFSLVEVMVGMLVGLIGMIVIFQMFEVSEARKRTTTSGSDAQTNGNLALFSIERTVRMAGYAINNVRALGCRVRANDAVRGDITFTLAPVLIFDSNSPAGIAAVTSPTANTDVVTVMYSGTAGVAGNDGVKLDGAPATGDPLPMTSTAGFSASDLVLVGEPVPDPPAARPDCALNEVTLVDGGTNRLLRDGAGTYNSAGGHGLSFTVNAFVFNLGAKTYDPAFPTRTTFAYQRFRIVNDSLILETRIPYAAANDRDADGWTETVIANGIVSLKALYGLDDGTGGTANDGRVDQWTTSTPATGAAWRQLKAVRLAVLARSGNREKDVVTTDVPSWRGGSFTMPGGSEWQHYRYRVYETDIPVRNLIWSSAS